MEIDQSESSARATQSKLLPIDIASNYALVVKVLQVLLEGETVDQLQLREALEAQLESLERKTPSQTFLKEEKALTKTLYDAIKSSQDSKHTLDLIRLLPHDTLLTPLALSLMAESDLYSVLPALCTLLQYTDAFNFGILAQVRRLENQTEMFVARMVHQGDTAMAAALVKGLQAQPYLLQLINWAPLFSSESNDSIDASRDMEFSLLARHLRSLVLPTYQSGESQEERCSRLKLVQSLILNKQTEAKKKKKLELQLTEEVLEVGRPALPQEPARRVELHDGTVIAQTPYVKHKVQSILDEIEKKPFGHFAIRGPAGSGKMTLIRLADQMMVEKNASEALVGQDAQGPQTSSRFIVVTLEETFDSKNLVGTYVCNETGDFVFKKGPLTVAAEQGLWLVLRNIEDTPSDLLSFLLPLIEQNTLHVTSTFAIKPKLGFRIFALTRSSQSPTAMPTAAEETIAPLLSLLTMTELDSLLPQTADGPAENLEQILTIKYPALFAQTQIGTNVHTVLQQAIAFLAAKFAHLKMHLLDFKAAGVTQMFSLYERVNQGLGQHLGSFGVDGGAYLSQNQRQLIIEEVHDVYLAYMYDQEAKKNVIRDLVSAIFNSAEDSMLDGAVIADYITDMGREHGRSNEQCFFGRASVKRQSNEDKLQTEEAKNQTTSRFVYTGSTVRSLEQICQSVSLNEAMLLVGETGTGKTTIVQELAKLLGKTLHVFNMNQNTDSADLLGGFKSVDLKYLLTPVYRLFLEVFSVLLNTKAANNAKFLTLMQKCFEQNQVKEFIQCLNHGLKSIKRSKNRTTDHESQINKLERQKVDLEKRAKKLVSGGGFIFQFVEGTLIKSIQEGDWILLDEINLASDSVLNKLATIVQGSHIMLNERADIVETKRHQDFRIFMCMNPPYSSAGKKQLPLSLRSKLTEIYVAELENEADLWDIIDRNTKSLSNELVSCLPENQKRSILQFYKHVRSEVQRQVRRGNIGLRNLCRALFFIKSAVQLRYPAIKAIYDSLLTCFASHLDQQLQETVRQMIMKQFEIRKLPTLAVTEESKDERYVYIEGNVIPKGEHAPANFDERNFILTPSFKNLLRQLASVVAVSNFAVILEGPTSAGKTSCVQYLAQVTHNKVIRINNHMHTDVQEYLGSYVPDSQTGKLVFQEGVLVEAVRHGYWVILDELNLAPSEVLEALNRLLDDNRELHIVETQTVVKAHPRFRIFATQNPTEGYGGRKELSEAFKNRFVLIRVLDVPTEELKEILVQKCSMPASRASLMIRVMEQLQIYRSSANLFSGKNAIITVRDLLKWAGRVNQNSQRGNHMDPRAIAMEGFFVLGERSRNPQDKLYIQHTIEKVFNVKLDIDELYETYFEENLRTIFDRVPSELNLPKIIASKQLKRLAVLVEKCLRNREPVLLVGETGCGKTTLCQVFASEVTKQALLQINCHQNTETSDFTGCMRTRKNLKQTQDSLAALLDETAARLDLTAELAKARTLKKKTKIVLARLTKQDEDVKVSKEIGALADDLNCVFEWHDGILVEAMQEGALLLIDEISLANDSVLERLNSVFEQDRVLMVTEKSSQEAIKIVAHEKFNMVATMNPSGDFGKKELSPALRNRMTEIWVESYFAQPELLELQKSIMSGQETVFSQVADTVDLFLIVSKLSEDAGLSEGTALAIFNVINFLASFSASESLKFQALKRKALSIRDILCIIDFLKRNISKMELSECFREAIELVVIDGLCLGIDTAGAAEQTAITEECHRYLSEVQTKLLPVLQKDLQVKPLLNNAEQLGVSHYSIEKKASAASVQTKFAFNAETTQTNLMKLLRAYTLGKPILIEGPPGVGKTALVEQVAKVTGRKLVRVNLSEQTDMMDLLGSEYPTSAGNQGNDIDWSDEEDQDEIQFRWGDGVLLSAIKEGHWLLIDEMNLAQQSILEGLNAILDHRRTVYIPELNKEYQCHPDFFVFACQNPSQSASSTSGRKTLPKSFLNRFTKIYLNELTNDDYRVILRSIAGEYFPHAEHIDWLLTMTQEIESICRSILTCDSSTVNMRDLSRFIRVYGKALTQTADKTLAIMHAFNTAYLMKEGVTDQQRAKCLAAIQKSFAGLLGNPEAPIPSKTPLTSSVRIDSSGLIFSGLLDSTTSFNSITSMTTEPADLAFADLLVFKGPQALQLQSLNDCLDLNLPVLLTTDDTKKLIKCLNVLAGVKNAQIRRILLSDRSDTTQLLGCFEQTSQDISLVLNKLDGLKTTRAELAAPILDLEQRLKTSSSSEGAAEPSLLNQVKMIESFLKRHGLADEFRPLLAYCKRGTSRFEWVDSVLVKAVSEGEWAVFENANICNASILDRLNPLLEEGNQSMPINEQGLDDQTQKLRVVEAHADFRSIFVLSRKTLVEQGRDVSRALRNRCLELSITFNNDKNKIELNPDVEERLDNLASVSLDARNLDWSLSQHQTSFDLLPLESQREDTLAPATTVQQKSADVTLGKRTRDQIAVSLPQADVPVSDKSLEAYPFLFLEHAKQLAGSEAAARHIKDEEVSQKLPEGQVPNGWQLYVVDQVTKLQGQLKTHRLKKEMVQKQLEPFFKCILAKPSEDCDGESMHLLLSSILQRRSLSQSLESALCLYLASRLQNAQIAKAIRDSGKAAELSFLFDNQEQGAESCLGEAAFVKALRSMNPNVIAEIQLDWYLDKGLGIASTLGDQKVFMFKTSASRLNELLEKEGHQGRVSISIRMLQGRLDDEPRQATVLLLNSEKEIMEERDMLEKLEDLDDAAQVLETPNLVVIPYDQASKSIQGVVTSQSFLYESLCDLKDWLRIQTNKAHQATRHFRQTKLPIAHTLLSNEAASVVANQIALLARPAQDEMSYEDRLIEATLIDQLTICVRDLPAFYACASSLAFKLRSISEARGAQEYRFSTHFQSLYAQQTDIDSELRDNLTKLDEKLQARLASIEVDSADEDRKALHSLAKDSVSGLLQSMSLIGSLQTEKVIQALIILPLEMTRMQNSLTFADQACQSYGSFYKYHLRSLAEALRLIEPKQEKRNLLCAQLGQLQELQADSGSKLNEKQQVQLRPLLAFTNNLLNEVRLVSEHLGNLSGCASEAELQKQLKDRCSTIIGLLESSQNLILPMFNHIVNDLFSGCLSLVTHTRQLCLALHCLSNKIKPSQSLAQSTVNLLPHKGQLMKRGSMLNGILRQTKQSTKELNEKSLLWALKLCKMRRNEPDERRVISQIFDYFVRREVARKLAEERARASEAEKTFEVPFKLRNQDLPDFVGKAMDEWTKEDVARMEAEAEKEIEVNFPSYFDEVQQQFFAGELSKKDYTRDAFTGKYHCTTVEIEAVFAEILGVTKPLEASYFLDVLKQRLDIVKLSMQSDKFEVAKRSFGLDTLVGLNAPTLSAFNIVPQWQEDTSMLLTKMLAGSENKSKQLMNISEVALPRSFNFYHDAYPEEARLVYEPMQNLLIRLRDIVIRDEYESPLLNESIFLANYIITCFNSEQTPLMKLLTSMDFLLTKLEEWENVYASKRLNSVENEINTLKMLIIRYRKIQILSWRNLLAWRKDKMVRDDVIECCRLAHTTERQIFDLTLYRKQSKGLKRKVVSKFQPDKKGLKAKTDNSVVQQRIVIVRDEETEQTVEAKLFELLDLFMRDSSLGVYQSRLVFIEFLRDNFTFKLEHQSWQQQELVRTRLAKVIHILSFIHCYYGQFEDKLRKTVDRLDSAARTKVKTLIDVSKWTVQKFTIVKNNIDKTHRQLNRTCKEEEEALLQNVQSLVIASSRKRYANNQDQLMSLHPEHDSADNKKRAIVEEGGISKATCTLAKQIEFMTSSTIRPLMANGQSLAEQTAGWMERLSEVRAVNKKHIQVRAYYDLLRFMKSQGLTQSSFNSSAQIQQLLIDGQLSDYSIAQSGRAGQHQLFRAYETFTMLQSASQVDDQSHIKNAEVIRMQSFSRSLMLHTLLLNKELVESKKAIESLDEVRPAAGKLSALTESESVALEAGDWHLTEVRLRRLQRCQELVTILVSDTKDRFSLLNMDDTDPNALEERSTSQSVKLGAVVDRLGKLSAQLEDSNCLSQGAFETLQGQLSKFEQTLDLEVPTRMTRLRLICDNALKRAAEIRVEELDQVTGDQDMAVDGSSTAAFDKNVKQVENLAKLTMQRLMNSFKALKESTDEQSQRKASLTADNSVGNVAAPEAPQKDNQNMSGDEDDDEADETSITEMLDFAKSFVSVLNDDKMKKLAAKSKLVFALRGLTGISETTRQRIESVRDTMEQLQLCLQEAQNRVDQFWRSMTKFSYLTQRVFIHLIYQGYCGQEDKDDPKEEPPSDLEADGEQDGMGMGDGKGGQNNITDQIEHEEQLEGLKNYESDQEDQQEDEKDEKDDKGNDDEEDNDFEMKNDFDGSMDSEPEEQNPEDKKEDDEDDEMDDVDDMLDNQLWDQNMEDMEQKEKEEQEKEEQGKEDEKRELDLGERDLDDQNLLPPNKDDENMAEGDDEKNQKEEPKEQPEQEEAQEGQEEASEDNNEEGERDEDEDEEGDQDMPLDKNEVLADEEEKFEEEAKSELASEPEEDADKENTDEVDSKFSEEQGADEDDENDEGQDENDEENVDDVQQKADQAVLEDDHIQAKENEEEEKKDMDQANLKRQNQAMQDQQKSQEKQNQANQDDPNQMSQADASGTDLLFDLQKQFKQRQEQKQAQKQQQNEQVKDDPNKKQVEQPQMAEPEEGENPEQDRQQQDQEMEDAGAAEYMHDDQAEQMQGKLAADRIDQDEGEEVKDEGNENPEDMPMQEDKPGQNSDDDDADAKQEDQIERTQAQVKESGVLKPEPKELADKDEEDKEIDENAPEEQKQDPKDLIAEYDAYLKAKAEQRMEVEESDDDEKAWDQGAVAAPTFTQNLDQFDYMDQKAQIRARYYDWLTDERERSQSLQLLAKFKNQTQAVSSSLCEQLRIVLEPQLSQNLQGDFKTGKRLNMKKVISFIASHYRNDKIWLRRTMPSKRDYKILIAIDDSMSMRENSQGFFSLEAMIALTEALNRLEVGKVAVARIRDRMDLVHSFDDTYTSEKASFIVSQFEFEHQAPTSADSAMANFVCDANKLLDLQNGGNSLAVNCPFVIVLSDGRFNKDNVRRYIREAKEKRYLYIFVILDKKQPQTIVGGTKMQKSQSILNMRSAVKAADAGSKGGRVSLVPYLRDFPFDYYCIVGDVSELPNALGTILVQWFSMVSATSATR